MLMKCGRYPNIHDKGKKLIWKPYISENNQSIKDLLKYAYKSKNGKPLFDYIFIQPSLYYSSGKSENYGMFESVFNEVVQYNIDNCNNTKYSKVGMQIEFDMGLVTGRNDASNTATSLQKRQFLNAYLKKVKTLKAK